MEIPTYIARQFPKPADQPGTSPASTGLPVAEGLNKLVVAAAEADLAFREQAADIERAQALSSVDLNVRKQTRDHEIELQKNPDWQTYDQRWADGFKKIKTDALASINDPEVKKAATLHVGTLESEGSMRASATSRKLAGDSFEAFRIRSKNTALSSLALSDDPKDEAAIAGIHLGVINAQEQGGWLAPDAAEKERTEFMGHFLVGRANRDIDKDPDRFSRDMIAGKYALLPVETLTKLEERYVRAKEKQDKDLEKSAKAEEKRRGSMAISAALYGELTQEDADKALRDRTISPEDHTSVSRVLAKNWEEGGVSDPQAHNDLLVKMYVSPFAVTPQQIAAMRSNGLLSLKDAREATKELMGLQETRGGVKDPRYNDGISKITKSISKGPMEVLSAPAARTLVLDIIEFEDRVLAKKEDPKAVSDEIALRNEQHQTGLLKSPIIPYGNINELNAAYRRKAVSTKLYEAYLRILQKQTAPKAPAAGGKKNPLGE